MVIFIRKFFVCNRSVKGFVIVVCLLQDFYIRRDPCTTVSNNISDRFTIEMSLF